MQNSHLIESHTDQSAKDPAVQKLVEEAKAYGEIKRKYRWFSNKPEGTQAYVMPKQWVRKWKNYTSYKQIKRNKLPLLTIGQDHPGQIATMSLLENFENYLRDDDEDDPANTILRTGVRDYYDFSLYSKELWEFFHSRYKGIPIRRKFEKVGMGMTRVEYRPKPVNLVIVPKISQLLENLDQDLPAPKKMYISIHRNVKDLIARIHFLLTSKCGYVFDKENFRVWKLNHQVDITQVNTSVMKGLKIFKESKEPKTNDELPNNAKNDEKDSPKTTEGGQKEEKKESAMEINANIYLKGFSLSQLIDSKVEDTDIADNDLIVVEIEDLEYEPHYIFRYKKGEKISFGKCEYCAQKKRLIVQCVCKEVDYCSEDCRRRDERFHQARCTADFQADEQTEDSQMGVVGLQNLGNTCFLNSSLQCLSNTWELTNYFLKRHHEQEINLDNPLGSNKAHLVKMYSQLVNALWYGRQKSLSPFQFKRALGEFQPNFKGYNQHDSHEALNFILDGIHQDLNRVKKKPLVESKASNNRPDSVVAHESWVGHLRRNQSIIVDLMHGQFKSTLDCPQCKGISVTFDPFSSIGLPVALMKDLIWDVIFVPYGNYEKPCLKTSLSFKRKIPIEKLREKFQELFSLNKSHNFIVAIVEDDTVVKFLSNFAVTDIFDSYSKRTHKIFLYQIDEELFQLNKHQASKDVKMEESENEQDENPKTADDLNNLQLLEQHEAKEKKLLESYKPLPVDNCNESVPPRYLRTLVQNSYATYSSNMAPPRVMFFDRNATTQEIHLQIFKAVSPMFEKYFKKNEMDPQDYEGNYGKIFSDSNKKTKKDYSTYYTSYSNRLPYKVKIVNKLADIGRRSDECFYCAKSYCNNCELPEGKDAFVYLEKKKKGSYAADLYGDPKKNEEEEDEQKIELTLNHILALVPKRKGKELMTNMHHYLYDENTTKSSSSYSYYGYSSYSGSYGSRYGKPKEYEVSDNLDFELMIEWSRSNCNSIYDIDPTNLSYYKSIEERDQDNNPKNDNRDDSNGGIENDDEDEKYDDRLAKSAKRIGAKKISSFTLEGCFKYFQQPEQLQPQNEWYCGKCKEHVLATKQVQIYKAPPILLILFKRFKMTNQSRSGYSSSYYYFSSSGASEGEKITDLISFPLIGLDIASFLVDASNLKCTLYDLFAVSNHYGSVGFGHYTAYAKNFHSGKWYYYDDSRVSEVKDQSEVISEAAYSLFYRRRDLKNTEINYDELRNAIDPDELAAIEKAEEEERLREKAEKERKKKAEQEGKSLNQLGGDADIVDPEQEQSNGTVSY